MTLIAVIVLCTFVVGNFAYSLRAAYQGSAAARDIAPAPSRRGRREDENNGEFPILGHAVHNFLALACAFLLIPEITPVSPALRVAGVIALVLVPVLNALLIIQIERAGTRRRADVDGGQ